MVQHLALSVTDPERSADYYGAALAPLVDCVVAAARVAGGLAAEG